MRCRACNCNLTDFESTRKASVTGEYVDLCNTCFHTILGDIETNENYATYDPERDDLDTNLDGSEEYPTILSDADEGGIPDFVNSDDEPIR